MDSSRREEDWNYLCSDAAQEPSDSASDGAEEKLCRDFVWSPSLFGEETSGEEASDLASDDASEELCRDFVWSPSLFGQETSGEEASEERGEEAGESAAHGTFQNSLESSENRNWEHHNAFQQLHIT